MRVLHLIGSLDPGGAETLVVAIASRERAEGHDHRIAHLGNAWLAGAARRHGVPEETIPSPAFYRSNATLPFFCAALAGLIRRVGPDVVHAHLFGMTVAAGAAARLAGVPCVATIHDRYELEERRRRGWLLRAAAPARGLAAVSADVARTIARRSGLAARVIPNGVDTERFRPDPAARAAVRAELGAGEEPVLLFVGRLEPVKRLDLLLDAFARLRAGGSRARLWVAGDGSERDAVRARAASLGIAGAAGLLGQREDAPRLLAAADLFLITSDSEGMPVSLLEAMAAGLPAVARPVGGIPEVVVPGETGLLVAQTDPAAWASAIGEALAPETARRMGAAARSRAVAEFSIEKMLAAYRDLYAAAARGARSA